ncbi:MAG TPA: YdaU family protein [Alphaproteobacteria bacterium]|nr:YdaU family protein [Alphaproteobacteria bacterium]
MSGVQTKAPRAWFAFYPGDYIRDTGHLSLREHGAYWKLLLYCYSRHEASIPHDRRYRITGADGIEEVAAVDCVLEEFFQRKGDFWFHQRVAKELAVADEKYKKLSLSGQRGAYKRWGSHGEANREAMATPMANDMANACQSQPQSHSPSHPPAHPVMAVTEGQLFKETHHEPKPSRQTQGQRLPADWQPDERDIAYCQQCGLDVARTSEDFRDYWLAESGQRARKLDWSLAWRRWCRTAAERQGGGQRRYRPAADEGLVAAALKTAHRNHEGNSKDDSPVWEG